MVGIDPNNNSVWLFCSSQHTLQYALAEKNQLKCINVLTLHRYKWSKNLSIV